MFCAGEPPYFLRHHDSSNTDMSELSRMGVPGTQGYIKPRIVHRGTNSSDSGEYRSVIDDLTIENRKLKERLRQYEGSSSSPHLDKDRLFEVKIHGLPAKKRRELEETLRAFASSINNHSNPANVKTNSRKFHHHVSGGSSHQPSSLSTSKSRPIDSAYASMSTSGPTSLSASNNAVLEVDHEHRRKEVKDGIVNSFLDEIPDGLLPKRSTAMTERQKKKAVVRRLEQLFIGKKEIGEHAHPLQQQEVSKSATRADRAADGLSSIEGLREANILPYEMEADSQQARVVADDSSQERLPSDSTTTYDSADTSPDQRPTRPLDLDPDRAQIPSDNVEYIRHLGLSTPNFSKTDSNDPATDADGWIYLNLLVNMAQLHIINVTPDFVRSAVADVSENFQLSRDGQKVRWRGGTRETRLSSDSGNSSAANRSPQDSDSSNEGNRKRRKIDVGKFASAPVDGRKTGVPSGNATSNLFHYKPLFHHRGSSDEELTSFDESDSPFERMEIENDFDNSSRTPHFRSHDSRSSYGKRSEQGPIVFYSGAQFCTDLSGDRGNINTPIHVTGVGKDGYSNHTQDALGCETGKRPQPERTSSGSALPYRPFKRPSKLPNSEGSKDVRRSTTPELLSDEAADVDFSPGWSSERTSEKQALQSFTASGLGGTQPADHFAAKVETRRTILDHKTRAKLSRFSAPSSTFKRFLHRIPEAFLKTFADPRVASSPDGISASLAELDALRSPSPQISSDELPVKIEMVSAQFCRLDPSPLPAPSGYYAATTSSEDDSTCSSSSSGESLLNKRRSLAPRFRSFSSSPDQYDAQQIQQYTKEIEMVDEEDEDEDDEDEDEENDDEDDDDEME